MGNKNTALCARGSKSTAYTDSYQSTASTQHSINLKKSFANGAISKDNFKILKVIGRGSFGKVFLVEKKSATGNADGSGDIYAMKVLKKANLLERNQIDHTRTEREVL